MRWPPTDEPAYGPESGWHGIKEGNFFTMADEDHPAYVLFCALSDLGWSWDISGGRHWCRMWKDCYHDGNGYGERRWRAEVNFSLWGQGIVQNTNDHGSWGLGLEDDGTWSEALPHITEFMKWSAASRKQIRK